MPIPKRILITPGEPAGVGPDITVHIAQHRWPVELVVIADPNLLLKRAKRMGLALKLNECDVNATPTLYPPGTVGILPITLEAEVVPGKLNPVHADYVMRTLTQAAALCQAKKAHAIVTGPVHKGVMNQASISFMGHTEFFAEYCGVKQTVMLFVLAQMKVALVTTHLALADVPKAITKERLKLTLSILHDELKQKFHIASPRILVCGLNPHAGEGGYLGREEIETIAPLLAELHHAGYAVQGPLAADTIFTPKYLQTADAVLAMYHDQALPLVKYAGFGQAVNVTLGLPFIRTSVDHGTALDVAGTPMANADSLMAAVKLAIELIKLKA